MGSTLLAAAPCSTDTTAEARLEDSLKQFIQSALEASQSGKLTTEEAMQLLDRAWSCQKLLWQLTQKTVWGLEIAE